MARASRQRPRNSSPDSSSLSALSEVEERFYDVPDGPAWKSATKHELPKILEKQADRSRKSGVDARDKTHGRTALHKAVARNNMERMRELIEVRHASINITDNAGVTPLHDACAQGHIEAVRYLLDMGAAVSPKDCEGDYPLLDAAQNDNEEICQMLLTAGANPTMQNSKGMSALSEAEEGPVKDLLRKYSSRFDSPGQNRMRITDLLTLNTTPRTHRHSTGRSPQRLSERNRPRSLQLNIDAHGARKVDLNGRDQLHHYAREGDDDLVEQFLDIQDCNFQDHYGDTPLHAAARGRHAHICGLLLQNGARLSVRNKKGNTALHEACYSADNTQVISALLDSGASSLAENYDKKIPSEIAASEIGRTCAETHLLEMTANKERSKMERKQKRRKSTRQGIHSYSTSLDSSPMQSPRVISGEFESRKGMQDNAVLQQQQVVSQPDDSKRSPSTGEKQGNALSTTVVAPSHPTQPEKTHIRAVPEFLSGIRQHSAPSHVDSCIRGSPLPNASPQVTTVHSHADETSESTKRTETNSVVQIEQNHSQVTQQHKRSFQEMADSSSVAVNTAMLNNTTLVTERAQQQQTERCSSARCQASREFADAIERQNAIMTAMLAGINALVAAQTSYRPCTHP